MASLDLGTLVMHIAVDGTDTVQDSLGDVAEAAQSVGAAGDSAGSQLAAFGSSLSSIGNSLRTAISEPLINLGKQCVSYASDLTETLSKTETVFGDMGDSVIEWSNTSVQSMGIAQETALNMASTFGDFSTAMGLSTEEAAEMSMSLTQLAADMASFKNISVERANIALNSIYTGETESLKAMGIVMTQANLQAYANTQGIQKNISAMTQQELVMLRYKYVMAQTKNAQGDFVRTGDSLANQSRKLQENIKELATGFGQILEPAVTAVVEKINELVSWFDSMSNSAKAAVVAAAAVAAGLPIVITAVGGIITVVTKLQAAVTTLLANPVVATIAAIVAALTVAAAAFGAIHTKIEEHNAVVAAMEDKHTTVTTSYENMVATSEKEGATASDTIAAIKETINGASDLIAYIEANEAELDGKESSEAVLDSIEAAIDAREMYCEIAGKKPENDAVWNELKNLQDGVTTGSITVSGVDSGGTLANISDLLSTTKADLDALAAYETNTIEPQIAFNEDPEKSAQSLLDKCKSILGYDGKTVDFTFGYTGLTELEQALGTAIASSENWSGTMDSIGTSLDSMLEKQKEVLLSIAAAQAVAALQANAAGTLSDAQLETTLAAINAQYRELASNVDTNSVAFENLVTALNDGNPDNDVEAWSNFAGSMSDLGIALTNTQEPAEMVSTASGEISQAMESGATDTDAMSGSVALMNDGLTQLADGMSNNVAAAYATYESDIAAANAAEQDAITAAENSRTAKEQQVAMMESYQAAWLACGGDVSAVTDQMEQDYGDEGAAFVTWVQDQLANETEYGGSMGALRQALADQLVATEKQSDADIATAKETANTAREEAERTLGTNLGAITSQFDQDELLALREQNESIGNAEGVSQVNRLLGLESYCRSAESMTSDNSFNMLALNRQYIGKVEGLSETSYSAGHGVTNMLGKGMFTGLQEWSSKLIAQAKSTVNSIMSEMRKVADIHSPSRKMRDYVGKPLMQGVAVGMEEETPHVVSSMRESMSRIMSAASPVGSANGIQAGSGSTTHNKSTVINQTNNFAARALTPYEQQLEIKRLNRGLAEVYA